MPSFTTRQARYTRYPANPRLPCSGLSLSSWSLPPI